MATPHRRSPRRVPAGRGPEVAGRRPCRGEGSPPPPPARVGGTPRRGTGHSEPRPASVGRGEPRYGLTLPPHDGAAGASRGAAVVGLGLRGGGVDRDWGAHPRRARVPLSPLPAPPQAAALAQGYTMGVPSLSVHEGEPAVGRRPGGRGGNPEEGPDSAGQAARGNPRGGDPWKVPQRTDRQRPFLLPLSPQGRGWGEVRARVKRWGKSPPPERDAALRRRAISSGPRGTRAR